MNAAYLAAGSLLVGTSGFFFTTVGLIGTLAAIKKSKYATLSYGITLQWITNILSTRALTRGERKRIIIFFWSHGVKK